MTESPRGQALGATVNRSQSQTEIQLDFLVETVGSLENSIRELEMRLESVLMTPEVCEDKCRGEEDRIVPLASKIRSISFKVQEMNGSMMDILRRLEL